VIKYDSLIHVDVGGYKCRAVSQELFVMCDQKSKSLIVILNSVLAKCVSLFIVYASLCSVSLAQSQNTVIEVGTATLPAYSTATPATPTPFTTINFKLPFPVGVVPNVFPMNTLMGTEPCTIRIRNITNTGFDAVCQEPINLDRAHGLILMDYIAIVDGVTTVPANTGDPVVFESMCEDMVDSEQFGPACDDCTGARNFQSVDFTTTFDAPPALLTQIISTNNQTAGEPDFIDVAIQNNSLDATGFNVAVERMEAGVGDLEEAEEICYLAVEREGCRDLNFSSFNGPSSVMFDAVFGGNVDGFGNGATSGEGATFTASCFSSTPIAVAKQRTRRGNNGGFLRRSSVSAAEIILTYDEDTVSDDERNHVDEDVSALAFSSGFTTPVTLNRAQITQRGRNTIFEWETAAEALHLGFDLWGEMNGEWIQLNKRLIASSGLDKSNTTRYRHRVRLTREQFNNISQFGISSVDNSGYEEFYGPFVVGEVYGELSNTEAIDWAATRKNFEQSMSQRGYAHVNGKWRKVSNKRQQRLNNHALGLNAPRVDMQITEEGVHSLNYEQLPNADQWFGQAISSVAVTLNNQAIARTIISDDDVFNQGDRVVFYGRLPEGSDSVYLNNYVYQLRLNPDLVTEANQYDGRNTDDSAFSTNGLVSQKVSQINAHSAFLDGGDPWYDSQLFVTSAPASKVFNFDLEQNIDTTEQAHLSVSVFGGINFPGDEPDHHVQVSLNGELIGDALFNGNILYTIDAALPADLLKSTGNVLSVTLPADTGFFVDLIQIDEIVVSGFKPLNEQTVYRFEADLSSAAYELDISRLNGTPEVYAHDQNGALTIIGASFDTAAGLLQFNTLPIERLGFAYSIGDQDSWLSPANINPAQVTHLVSDDADYLIIAHPSFIGEKLDEFVELKQQQGFKPRVLNWLEIVSTYGFGNDTPAALEEFLRVQSVLKVPDYVLLVGGHTFDYRNVISDEVVNFLPTHYRPLGIFNFAPTDNPYADLNNDNIPEFAIGRWPVRSADDLSTIVNKTKAWHAQRDSSSYQNGLLIAQANDSRDLNYTDQMDGRVAQQLSSIAEFDQLTRVYMPQVIADGASEPINTMREQIAQTVRDGVDFISFAGHGSNAAWGTQTIVNTDFVKSLNNQGRPPVVMPLACYTTNYETLSSNTLAHQWLFANVGDQQANTNIGSVAIHGATVLGEYRENAIFAERYLRQVNDSATLGEAIKKAKQEMATQNTMLNNWALLGDPALPLR